MTEATDVEQQVAEHNEALQQQIQQLQEDAKRRDAAQAEMAKQLEAVAEDSTKAVEALATICKMQLVQLGQAQQSLSNIAVHMLASRQLGVARALTSKPPGV